jgi:hypothetical protein
MHHSLLDALHLKKLCTNTRLAYNIEIGSKLENKLEKVQMKPTMFLPSSVFVAPEL